MKKVLFFFKNGKKYFLTVSFCKFFFCFLSTGVWYRSRMHPNKDAFLFRSERWNTLSSLFLALWGVSQYVGREEEEEEEKPKPIERQKEEEERGHLLLSVQQWILEIYYWVEGKFMLFFLQILWNCGFLQDERLPKKNHHKVFVGHFPVLVFCPSFSCIGYCWKRGRRNPYTLTSSFWYYRA